jgi:hypothetical protein
LDQTSSINNMTLSGSPQEVRNLLGANVASTPPHAKIENHPAAFD